MHYYLDVLKKYATFSGRASRSEFWYFTLFNFIIQFVASFILGKISPTISMTIVGIYGLLVFLPSLAVSVRRLHDTNRSWVNLLWVFLPIIGWIVLLIFFVTDSLPGENQYGKNPKGQ